jgi:hypothetical protein
MAGILERPTAPTRHRLDVDAYYRMADAGVLTDPCRAAVDQAVSGQLGEPGRIGHVGLATGHVLHVRGVAQRQLGLPSARIRQTGFQ